MASEWDLVSKKKCLLPSTTRIVRSICESFPVKDIPHLFDYIRVFDDGTCIVLSIEPEAIKEVFDQCVHITAHIPSYLVKDKFWYLLPTQGPYFQILATLKNRFNFCHLMDFIERDEGFHDVYCFTSSEDPEIAASIYLNQHALIGSMISDFKSKIKPLLNELTQDKIRLNPKMLPNIQGLKKEQIDLVPQRNQLLLGAEKLNLNFKKFGLSKREEECVNYLTLGLTSKEIASELDLSFRTVESYILNIRSKLGCSRKSEIIKTLIAN